MLPVSGRVNVLVTRLITRASRSGPSASSATSTSCPTRPRRRAPTEVSRSVCEAFTSDHPHRAPPEQTLRAHRQDRDQHAEDDQIRVLSAEPPDAARLDQPDRETADDRTAEVGDAARRRGDEAREGEAEALRRRGTDQRPRQEAGQRRERAAERERAQREPRDRNAANRRRL